MAPLTIAGARWLSRLEPPPSLPTLPALRMHPLRCPPPCSLTQDYSLLKNIGTGYLSTELSERLISSVRRQLPNISGFVNKSIMDLQKELEAMVRGARGGVGAVGWAWGTGQGGEQRQGGRQEAWTDRWATSAGEGAAGPRRCLAAYPAWLHRIPACGPCATHHACCACVAPCAGRPCGHVARRDDPPGAHALPQV